MSIELMTRVWKTAPVNGSELLVLLALADFGNDDGTAIYPSIKTIAGKARLSDDQTRRIIHKLITLGLIELVEAGGWDGSRNRSNEYRITMQPPCIHASTGTRVDASTVPAPVQVPSPRRHKGGTRVDASTGTCTDATTVLAPVQDDPSLEPPLQPLDDPSVESSSSEDEEDDTSAASAIDEAWERRYGQMMPESVMPAMNKLLEECGEAAVLHGIHSAADNGARTFGYIAKCARNYVPPATAGSGKSYAVDLPGVHRLTPPPQPAPAYVPPPPPPMAHDDPWAVALGELQASLPGVARDYLAGSRLEEAGTVDGVPLYRVVCGERAAAGLSWLTTQAGPVIRRKLGSVLGKPVLVEIVADAVAEVEQPHA